MNKALVGDKIGELISLIAHFKAAQTSDEQRSNFDLKEVNADFVTAQVKSPSFIAYFKAHKNYLMLNSDLIVNGIL